MQKIKIASIDTKEGDNQQGHWKSFIITGDDKTKVSTFDHSASSLKAGDVIEAEIEVKGKYTNLKTFKLIEHGTSPPPRKEPQQTGGDSRAESIEAQVAVKAITELRIANALTDKSPAYRATLRWCEQRLGVKQLPPSDELEPQTSPIKTESKEEAPVGKDETPISPEQLKQLYAVLLEASMTVGDLGKWMVEQKWIVRKPGDIKQWQYNEILKAFEKNRP